MEVCLESQKIHCTIGTIRLEAQKRLWTVKIVRFGKCFECDRLQTEVYDDSVEVRGKMLWFGYEMSSTDL